MSKNIRAIRIAPCLIFVFVALTMSLQSCSETVEEPVIVESQIVFWTHVDDDFGSVRVTIEGVVQTCTKVTGDYGPACGKQGFATYTLPPGDYEMEAQEISGAAPLRTWRGTVTVYANTCYKYRLQ